MGANHITALPWPDRLWARVARRAPGDCWIWSNPRSTDMLYQGRLVKVQRLAWLLTTGPIPDGHDVARRCGSRLCVNPAHLYLHARLLPWPQRLWVKIARGTEDACWPWKGTISSTGYGAVSYRHRKIGAHRLTWMLTKGDIPEGLHVLHRCDNPPCCNPAHLFLGTNAENVADRVRKGRNPIELHPESYRRGPDNRWVKRADALGKEQANG